MTWLMTLLVLVQADSATFIDVRLQRHTELIATLNTWACRPAVWVKVGQTYGARGRHEARRIWVGSPDDEYALVHEFGHLVQVTGPQIYFEWADSMGVDPWRKSSIEAFADAFVSAFSMVQAGTDFEQPERPKRRHKRGDEVLARRMARRVRRRRDEKELDDWCLYG